MLNVSIRQEERTDAEAVFNLIEKAFEKELHSDQKEQFLVERLHQSNDFIPELSLVATRDDKVVGYILLSKILIESDTQTNQSLAMAPVAVLPEYQGQKMGAQLIEETHLRAKSLGYDSIILLGHEHYYPRFGYKLASNFNITLPFDVPDENCMAIELIKGALEQVSGTVVYPNEFYE